MILLLPSSLCIVLPSVLSSACLLVLKTCHHNSQKRSGQWIAFILHSSLIYSIKLQEHGPLKQTGGSLFKAGRQRSLSAATSGKQLQKRMFTCCKVFLFPVEENSESLLIIQAGFYCSATLRTQPGQLWAQLVSKRQQARVYSDVWPRLTFTTFVRRISRSKKGRV